MKPRRKENRTKQLATAQYVWKTDIGWYSYCKMLSKAGYKRRYARQRKV